MGIFDGILICTDLDGTLYRDDKTISRENREAIDYFKREGGRFTFITGRMPYYSQDAYRAVRPNAPFGCCNGGALYDGEREDYVFSAEPIAQDVIELIDAVIAAVPAIGVQYASYRNTYFAKENIVMEEFRRETDLPNLTCPLGECPAPIMKVIFGGLPEELAVVERVLRAHARADEFFFVRSEQYLFEILRAGVDKGMAIGGLCDLLGIDRKKSIAIGDYNNDIPMLTAAGVGIAVANACPEALAAADLVTVSNEESAIARVIADVASGKIAF